MLEIRIARFDTDPSGDLTLDCTWKLQPVAGRLASPHHFSTSVPVASPDAALTARTAAMNEALARLAREIARGL